MNYLIRKNVNDSRKGICGFVIPDGFMTVVELTFENRRRIENVMNLPHKPYSVEKTDLPEGYYASNGRRVTLDSIYDWFLYGGQLVYIDEAPPAGHDIPSPVRDVRPPDMSKRPDYVGLDDLPADQAEESPEVKRAREILEKTTAEPAPKRPVYAEDKTVPGEDDVTTLKNAGGTDELTMLRAALDSRGIEWNKSMNRIKLRKMLEESEAA